MAGPTDNISGFTFEAIVAAVLARLMKRLLAGATALSMTVGGGGVWGAWNWTTNYIDERFARSAAEAAVASAPNRLGYLRDKEFFEGLRTIPVGETRITLSVGQTERRQLQLDVGRYRIDALARNAEGQEHDVDPLLYLYRLRNSGTAVDAIDVNNDSGSESNSGRDSRIDFEARAGTTYYVEVHELMNRGGAITLDVRSRP